MTKRILFIEDEKWSVNAYFKPLEDRGIEVELAKDGDEAIQKLKQHKFDVIALDVMFPTGNALGPGVEPRKAGVKLLRMIRQGEIEGSKVAPNVKVVILTAVLEVEISRELNDLGVTHYLNKPISFAEAIETLANA